MRLISHNMLTSNIKGVKNGFPLKIEATDVQVKDTDFNPEFVARMIPKLEWNALVDSAVALGYGKDLPKEVIDDYEQDNDFLKKVHHVLLEIEVMEGNLVCPETGRCFPITKGIPNMLLNENEV